ncbi:MAG: hypothetical protein ACFB21_00435, partial [Opitutales bacterium]
LAGFSEPVTLALSGCPWRDLAGHRLNFTNRKPPVVAEHSLSRRQVGCVGDITASRKVRVPDCSIEEMLRLSKLAQSFPWHWDNSLYLEWYSETNGRVVIETVDYALTVTGEATWRMTEADEAEQRQRNEAAMARFFEQVAEALEQQEREDTDDNEA